MRVTPILTLPVLLLSLSTSVLAESSAKSVQEIVQDANRLLAEGSYSQAARAYSEAIELEPSTYVNYYKRATAYLSLGRSTAALDDFDRILQLNPAFSSAHFQKAKILAREGDFDSAGRELKAFGKSKSDPEAGELEQAVGLASAARASAEQATHNRNWQVCIDHATKALEVGSNSLELREMRLKCATELGDIDAVYGDLSRLSTLNPSNLVLPIQLSQIAYFLLGSEHAMNHIKQCLHYDPDSKACKKVHKTLRSLQKDTTKASNLVESGNWRQAIKILDGSEGLLARFETAFAEATGPEGHLAQRVSQSASQPSQARLDLYAMACKASVGANDFGKRGTKWCDVVLSIDPDNTDALVAKGERLLKDESWDEAVRTLQRAFEATGNSSQDIMNRLNRAQKLLKVSKQKDYYKVLGVSRDADDRTIKRAFRTAAKTAHPDVGGSEEKMAALNQAYEVLSDAELRQRYDNGDDPNDPHGGQQQNPFAHHGGGMPFQFFQSGGGGGGNFFQQGGGRGFPGGGGQNVRWEF